MTRYLALDSIRGICAVLVAVFHFPAQSYLTSAAHNAYLFVDFFFVLSGFVIMHAYGKALAPAPFLLRRIGRVWPLHVTMLLVLIALEVFRYVMQQRGMPVGPPAFVDEREPLAIVTNFFLVHCWGVHDHDTWNGPSWSISVEMLAYIAFALTALLPWRRVVAAVIVVVAWVVIAMSPDGMASTYDYGVFRGLTGFFLGVLVYRPPPVRGTWAELLAVGLVATVLAIDEVALVAPAVFAFTVSVFSAEEGVISGWLMRAGPRKLGEWSYSIYMTHAPLMICVLGAGVLASKLTGVRIVEGSTLLVGSYGDVAVLVYLVAVIAVSSVTYRLVEKRFRAWFNERAKRLERG